MYITGERIERVRRLRSAAARRSEVLHEALRWINPTHVEGLAHVRCRTEGVWTLKRLHLESKSSGRLDMLKLVSLSGLKSGSLVLVKLVE